MHDLGIKNWSDNAKSQKFADLTSFLKHPPLESIRIISLDVDFSSQMFSLYTRDVESREKINIMCIAGLPGFVNKALVRL